MDVENHATYSLMIDPELFCKFKSKHISKHIPPSSTISTTKPTVNHKNHNKKTNMDQQPDQPRPTCTSKTYTLPVALSSLVFATTVSLVDTSKKLQGIKGLQ